MASIASDADAEAEAEVEVEATQARTNGDFDTDANVDVKYDGAAMIVKLEAELYKVSLSQCDDLIPGNDIVDKESIKVKVDQDFIDALSRIVGNELLPDLIFKEDMEIMNAADELIGSMRIGLSLSSFRGASCYEVEFLSMARISDRLVVGSAMKALISPNLVTLQQVHLMCVGIADRPLKVMKMYINTSPDGLMVIEKSEDGSVERNTYSNASVRGLISEGADKILQRIISTRGLSKELRLMGLDNKGYPCIASYELVAGEDLVDSSNETHGTVGVLRKLMGFIDADTEKWNDIASWRCDYLSSGKCAIRRQKDSPLRMMVSLDMLPVSLSLQGFCMESSACNDDGTSVEDVADSWESDMELMSQFIKRRDQLQYNHEHYIENHPELRALLTDFIKLLLLRKPDDVYHFANDFFSSCSSM